MATTDAIVTLRQFLDRGGVIERGEHEMLGDDMTHAEQLPPRARMAKAERARAFGTWILEQGAPDDLIDICEVMGMRRLDGVPARYRARADEARRELWRAEIFGDDALRRRLIEELPSDLRASHEATMAEWRRPLGLNVRIPDGYWSCLSCGDPFDEGDAPAFVVERLNDYGNDLATESLTFCLACLASVNESEEVSR